MWLLADEMCMCIYIASSYAKASNKNIKRRSTYQKQGKTMTRENQGESKKDCKQRNNRQNLPPCNRCGS